MNEFLIQYRSGKNTHISRISNSVTHRQSYTNTTITGNAAPGADITTPKADIAASSTDIDTLSADIAERVLLSSHRMVRVQVFHNVLRCLVSHAMIDSGACALSNCRIGDHQFRGDRQ